MLNIVTGLGTGFALGWALQRGGFCMNTAFRSIVFKEDRSVLRAWVLVLLINIPVLAVLEELGFIRPSLAPFRPLSFLVGGLLFGAGMVWAGGCVSGTYYRSSKGMLGSLVALGGFLLGALSVRRGVLLPFRQALERVEWTIYGDIPRLSHIIPSNPWVGQWIIIALVIPLGVVFLLKAPKTRFAIGWKWPLTGSVVGILAILAWIFSAQEARGYGLSLVQPTTALGAYLFFGDPSALNWTAWLLIGLIPGAFFAAWKNKDLKLRLPEPRRLLIQLMGGIVMGIGASLAGGCNIGHGITGLSSLSLSSAVATLFTMLGNWGATAFIWQQSRRGVTA
ncbi:MAG: YeeE/YedE family protein [Spirochaetales bacterium]|nr:YeeE/YedE family protein [Spirochaetales bacterium]